MGLTPELGDSSLAHALVCVRCAWERAPVYLSVHGCLLGDGTLLGPRRPFLLCSLSPQCSHKAVAISPRRRPVSLRQMSCPHALALGRASVKRVPLRPSG